VSTNGSARAPTLGLRYAGCLWTAGLRRTLFADADRSAMRCDRGRVEPPDEAQLRHVAAQELDEPLGVHLVQIKRLIGVLVDLHFDGIEPTRVVDDD
jgi:hypothetical protein